MILEALVCELDKYVPVVPTVSKPCSLLDFRGAREFMQAAPRVSGVLLTTRHGNTGTAGRVTDQELV